MIINCIERDIKPRADLSGANLSGADLSWANLSGANLSGADLSGADLSGVRGVNPATFLTISIGIISDKLTLALMEYDCVNLENGRKLFDN